MQGTDEKGTASSQDRARQPKRSGGNSIAFEIEDHNQKKSLRIAQGSTTGTNKQWGFEFDEGGNSARGKSERHGNEKGDSLGGRSRDIPSNIEIAERKDSSGNSSNGSHEPMARGAEKISPARRFDS